MGGAGRAGERREASLEASGGASGSVGEGGDDTASATRNVL